MGDIVIRPQTPTEVLCQLNSRFAPGPALQEMVANHKLFQIFHASNSLVQIYQVLNIGPADYDERKQYYQFLDHLKIVPSDQPPMNGHDRIIQARRENLEQPTPLPIHTMIHSAKDNPAVTVTQGKPLPHDPQTYLIISTPTAPPKAKAAQPAAMARLGVRRGRRLDKPSSAI